MRSILVLIFVFALTGCTFAQVKASPEEQIISVLEFSKPEAREQALRNLGVPDEVAKQYDDLEASMSGAISWYRLGASATEGEAALFLPCRDESGAAYLFLLVKSSSGWKVSDSTIADCHYKADVSVELVTNLVPGRDSILLHQDCDEHGTGYASHRLHVFNTVQGKLHEILDSEEALFQDGGDAGGLVRRSMFVPIRSLSITGLEQTEITQQLDKVTGQPSAMNEVVRRRIWRWSPQKHRLVATRFQSVHLPASATAP